MELTTGWSLNNICTEQYYQVFSRNIYNNNLTLTGSSGNSTKSSTGPLVPLNLSCDWLITVPEGNIVKLSFDKFSLEESTTSGCTRDYVDVLDGNSSFSQSRGRFCGYTELPKDIRSSGRYMRVRFISDWLYTYYEGFKATFVAEDKTICPYHRQFVTAFSSHNTTLTSPYYPMNPANDLDCTWVLAVDSDLSSDGYIVKVTFSVLELECEDSLKFYDGNNNTVSRLLGSYCNVHPEVIYSTGHTCM
ncbi:hypothetical protein OS493_025863 [Desmophyllum pertusum]|uniref:CUB domain-containing protein n=1 Tax=Desmophyllum pertusum TaxID=174260 RepID=A0A9W9YXQ7_9CNID|nr:hypothetical protein OS493_025863 [Desmophyllum pertusum]